jgi:hypothetical protein
MGTTKAMLDENPHPQGTDIGPRIGRRSGENAPTSDCAIIIETSIGHGTRWVCPLCGIHGPYTGSHATTQINYLNTGHALIHRKPIIEHSCGRAGDVTIWVDLDHLGWRATPLPVLGGWMLEAAVDHAAIAILGIYPTLEAVSEAIGVDLAPALLVQALRRAET